MPSMRVIGWSNGQPRPTGAGYGVRFSDHDRDDYFDPGWHEVVVNLDQGETVSVPLSKSFWRSCPELRSIGSRWGRPPNPRRASGCRSAAEMPLRCDYTHMPLVDLGVK